MGENDSCAEQLNSQESPDACLPWQRKVAQTWGGLGRRTNNYITAKGGQAH